MPILAEFGGPLVPTLASAIAETFADRPLPLSAGISGICFRRGQAAHPGCYFPGLTDVFNIPPPLDPRLELFGEDVLPAGYVRGWKALLSG